MDKVTLCKKCNNKMTLENRPDVLFFIPFTKQRFAILDYNMKQYACVDCEMEEIKRLRAMNEGIL